ncbi:pirin family protein [Lysobacter enzymogenes]|uniref:pirin family protein n=1 Tax=Lysobacter enzymogenes TaxID=69 RepID=UPI001AF72F8A|nr:pirin family protein [Lysobacter enzymogenes]QQQ00459.1 pirin family protein [Lysobacter enzymogenes]
MIIQRLSRERGRVPADGSDSLHTFSSGAYYDPAWMGFGALRVLREVRAEPGAGLAVHRHANMDVFSYVLEGAMGFEGAAGSEFGEAAEGDIVTGVVRAGELQWLGAGHGMRHRAFNAAADAPLRFLQIWIQPDRLNARPAYALSTAPAADARGWALRASRDGGEGGVPVRQDLRLFTAALAAGADLRRALDAGRAYWLQIVAGEVRADGRALAAGDALGLVAETGELALTAGERGAQALLLELPPSG